MESKLLLQHGSEIYDATPILEGGIEWFASVMGQAGRLKFRVLRDGIINFVEGDKVSLYLDGILRFVGWVMTKARTSEQIISVTAYDQMFYLARNKGTYVYQNKTAAEVVQMVAADYGLQTGTISDSGWVIGQRIEEGEVLMDILLSALDICGKATGKEYFLFDKVGALTVQERSEMQADAILRCDGGIRSYTYQTDISQDTYNAVKLYHAGRKETERLAYQAENGEKIAKWGRLEHYRRVPYAMNDMQLRELGNQILQKKCRVRKKLTVENINGDVLLFAGNSIWLEIPDLAEISMKGLALIESCTHIFRDGEHITRMEMRIEEE